MNISDKQDREISLASANSNDTIDKGVENDQGHVIVAIGLVLIFFLILGFFATYAFADEPVDTATPAVESKEQAKEPVVEWKPPVTPKVTAPSPIDPEQSKAILEKWGVEIISLNLTAAGYMMDFRYRVHDVEKSKIFFDSRIKPYLHVEKSNAKLPVPMAAKVGAFRPTNRGKNIKPNKIYYMVFGNPDAHVKSGEKVTLVIGDFKAEHLTVH